jgi:phosphoribosylanthranilate isomerase
VERRLTLVFRIKICGITREEDARLVAEAGADAIGLNFYAKSPRFIELEQARRIVTAVPSSVAKVGVFVNAAAGDVTATFDELGLDYIQLHGDEPAEMLAELGSRPFIRAFRCGPSGMEPVTNFLGQCRRLGCVPAAVLVDAFQAGQYGGTGQVADWIAVADWQQRKTGVCLALAGGLTPSNVAQAIAVARPFAVDTASGVEASPRQKDVGLVRDFVAAARDAFAKLLADG